MSGSRTTVPSVVASIGSSNRPCEGNAGSYLVPALLIILALALGAIAAAWYFTKSDSSAVPAVEGLALNDAVSRVEQEGFKADIISEPNEAQPGTVFRQNPSAGTDLDDGSTVQLFSSKGPQT